jgi:hypothetical protein
VEFGCAPLISWRSFAASVDFDKADIALGKRLVKQHDRNQFAMGELADRIETKYGDNTLEDFSAVIGIAYSTLKDCRHVHRKWKDSPVKPRNFSVAKALASYKDKDQYIQEFHDATELEARAYVRRSKKDAKETKARETIDAERGGIKPPLGNWSKATEKLTKEIKKYVFDNWEHQLDLMSQRRYGITVGAVADLIMILDSSADMLLMYKERFKSSAMIIEYKHDEPADEG